MSADNIVSFLIGIGNEAIDLLWVHGHITHKAHYWQWRIAWLLFHYTKIYRSGINTSRRACF